MTKLNQLYESAESMPAYAQAYAARLSELLRGIDYAVVEQIAEAIEAASRDGKVVYFIGNGGSAAIGAHWVNDLVAGSFLEGRPGFRAVCLSDNVSGFSALGNDAGYENVFVQQLKVHLNEGDVVFAMSVSGNSENIIRAVDYANGRGATTIGLSGFNGGRLRARCTIDLHIETTPDEYGPVEDIFGILDHMVTGYLTMRRGKKLHH